MFAWNGFPIKKAARNRAALSEIMENRLGVATTAGEDAGGADTNQREGRGLGEVGVEVGEAAAGGGDRTRSEHFRTRGVDPHCVKSARTRLTSNCRFSCSI